MGRQASAALALTLCFAASTHAAQSDRGVVVLGVPLGERFTASRHCETSELMEAKKSPCWVGNPMRLNDGRFVAGVSLPGKDAMPAWAAHATFEVLLSRVAESKTLSVRGPTYSGAIDALKVNVQRAISSKTGSKIIDSISSRFGPPSVAKAPSMLERIDWHTSDLDISVECIRQRDECNVRFETAASAALARARSAQREEVEAKRPKAP